ncbi:hypothetical protein 13AC503A_gene0056 [Aeromonas phage 13AC503A]|nr:hypothetical protein 13AC503A_gene0056 [Aeromonas phage 13AC503A]
MSRVTINHLRVLGYCVPGIRGWCQENGFNMRDFREWVDACRLRETGDPFAIAAADLAEQENEQWVERKAKQSAIDTLQECTLSSVTGQSTP